MGEVSVRNIIRGLGGLLTVDAANMLLPLITLPYLVGVIGLENVGILAVAAGIAALYGSFIEFSYDLYLTRKVAIYAKDKKKIDEQISLAIFGQLYIAIGGFLLISVISYFVTSARGFFIEIILYAIAGIGAGVAPRWLFIGLQKIGIFSVITLASKLLYAAAIFILVDTPDEYVLVPVLYCLSTWLSALWSWLLIRKAGYRVSVPQPWVTISFLGKGVTLFYPRFFGVMFSNAATVLLGLQVGPSAAGGFSLVSKLYNVPRMVIQTITTAIYPVVSQMSVLPQHNGTRIIRTYLLVAAGLIFCGSGILLFGRVFFVPLILPDIDEVFVDVFGVLVISLPIIFASQAIGQFYLLQVRAEKEFSATVVVSIVLYLLFLPVIISVFGVSGAAWLVVGTESLILGLRVCVYLIRRLKAA